jgi:dipeptidyl aminopeptidase/acylaminoacyl peptidase
MRGVIRLSTAWTGRILAGGACFLALSGAASPPAPGLEELVQVTDLSGIAVSPDGSHVAFRTDRASIDRNSYDLAWHVVDLRSARAVELGSGGDPIIADPGLLVAEAPIWSPDGRWIYFRRLRSAQVQIWRTAADGSGSAAVTDEDGDVLSIELSENGRGIDYRVGPPRGEIERAELDEYDSGILVDAHVELGQNLYRGAILNGRHATQRLTGQWFARGGLLWDRPSRNRRLDFATLLRSPADPPPAPESARPAPASPELAVRSRSGDLAGATWDGEAGQLTVRRAGGSLRAISCGAPACRTGRIAWLAWRPDHDQIVFATADRAHRQTLHLWDVQTGRVRPVATSEGLLNGGRSASAPCAVTARKAICVAAGPVSPPRLESIDLGSGARRILIDPNVDLRSRRWPDVERLEWRGSDGRLFTGTLFMPRSPSGPLPLFINYYRCEGFLRGGVGDEWPFAPLAASGIASICINATRMTGPQDGVGQYRAALGGIEAVVDLLAGRGLIDRNRVGIGGLSFGSEVAMWVVMHSNLIAAASVASPQFEPANYWFNGVRGRDHHELLRRIWGLGAPEETPEQWRLLSPALSIERIRAPLLMQLPEQESRYAIELYARLSNSATPAELHVFPDEPHIKVQPRHRLAVYRRNLDWFRFWLQGHEDGDPRRAGQYRRWRSLSERAVAPPR